MEPGPGASPPRSSVLPIAWVAAALLGTILVCTGVGISGYSSESAGVTAAYVAAFPLGFLLCGALVALVVHFAMKQSTTAVRAGAPAGCGCLGGLGLLGFAVLFFEAIFPAL